MVRFYFLAFMLCSSIHQSTTDHRSSYTYTFKSNHQRGTVLERLHGYNTASCALFCLRKASCTTAIIDEMKNICSLAKLSKKYREKMQRKNEIDGRFLYIDMLGSLSGGENNDSYKDKAFKNCQTLKDLHPDAPSGVYWIDPSVQNGHAPSKQLQAYCDQKTEGGGWTLVWTYTFTNYKNFDSPSNAITPLPSWSHIGRRCDSPKSRTAPLSEDQTGAMPSRLWPKIGSRFLIKSNIMNWISCSARVGSFVQQMAGSIKCHVVRNLSGKCHGVVPDTLSLGGFGCGPKLVVGSKNPVKPTSHRRPPFSRRPPWPPSRRPPPNRCHNTYIDFNGSQTRGWPVHDPCGTCSPNHLKGVANPRVNVYIHS